MNKYMPQVMKKVSGCVETCNQGCDFFRSWSNSRDAAHSMFSSEEDITFALDRILL